MSEVTLAQALVIGSQTSVGRVLVVETNAKGDGTKPAEILSVEVLDIKVVQFGNPNIIAEKLVGSPLRRTGNKKSFGGNTKVR